MNRDGTANEDDVAILRRFFGSGAGKNILHLMSHASKMLPEGKDMLVNPSRMHIVVGRDLNDFHRA
jgi:CRISPR/Cas system CMR-associated protein Cmr5 small subunit